jgi:ribosome-associated protein
LVTKSSFPKRQSLQAAKKTIKIIAQLALNKKAEDLVVLDIHKLANFCDYFIICSGTSDRHAKAIADGIQDGLKEAGLSVGNVQGYREGKWVIVDSSDIVIHIFEKTNREFYGLEYLWQGGKKVTWEK